MFHDTTLRSMKMHLCALLATTAALTTLLSACGAPPVGDLDGAEEEALSEQADELCEQFAQPSQIEADQGGHVSIPERRAVLDQIAGELLSDLDPPWARRLRVIEMLLVVAVLARRVVPALRVAFEILGNVGRIEEPEDAPFHYLGELTGTRTLGVTLLPRFRHFRTPCQRLAIVAQISPVRA